LKKKVSKKIFNIESNVIAFKAYVKSINEFVNVWLFQILVGGYDLAEITNLAWATLKNDRICFKHHKNRRKKGDGGCKIIPKNFRSYK